MAAAAHLELRRVKELVQGALQDQNRKQNSTIPDGELCLTNKGELIGFLLVLERDIEDGYREDDVKAVKT